MHEAPYAEDVKDTLKGVAVQLVSKGWIFRYPTDEAFIAQYGLAVAYVAPGPHS